MRYPRNLDDLRRRRLVVAGVVIGLLLAAFIAYMVLTSRSSTTTGEDVQIPSAPPSTDGPAPAVTTLEPLRATADPEAFARGVAEALFRWDTTTLISRTDHIEQLVAVADPTGESSPGLVSDLANYLPTQEAWVELGKYETRQWLSIDSVTVPTKWADAQAQARDELAPGTAAFTVDGARHRSGVWEGSPVASEHDVAFTIFIVCGPSYPECHLLRLSMLDKPLE